MTAGAPMPLGRRSLRRADIELMVAIAWNAEGRTRGLRPLAWEVGDADFVHFIGSADAYSHGARREIIEDWIAELGLADVIDSTAPPLHREGADMVWTGAIDSIGMQFHYPAEPDDADPYAD
ncbi:hypothetical protein [Clavibacter nebraskensis]|uniref:Uncharacterized protein n=2 Tax=Clavibacter nebraskensis TaxID=31963 RepID=A0A399PIT0_9MICO|nr:hypothetical protein [Clavibacter nebraskensis]KXU21550.1 hypothetical protein VV38_02870 [Clavibacter nebraskensis]OAH19138.1 hypothetical protein A3Q38_08635 [Clavibacter nebraskensis]QGV65928.1 hypothetical protein EGX36_03215 [Clavibacter nebraskensis]QGV68725.1 hypothetical protein EGX37_03200 [Clavibacter nebraskensis]QGV71515.1 hypothetical protein EGX35_03200 [Clavibacter nebraskensis]